MIKIGSYQPSESAFTYALNLAQKWDVAKGATAADEIATLTYLATLDGKGISSFIDNAKDALSLLASSATPPAPVTTPSIYQPPAGHYMVDGKHYTIKKGKSSGYVYLVDHWGSYLGGLTLPKNASIMVQLDTPDKAYAAVLSYSAATHKCGVCNTKLSDPKSIAAGIGPVCAKKYGKTI